MSIEWKFFRSDVRAFFPWSEWCRREGIAGLPGTVTVESATGTTVTAERRPMSDNQSLASIRADLECAVLRANSAQLLSAR